MKKVVEEYISFDGMYDLGTCMYMASGMFNGLLRVDKCNKSTKYMRSFDGEEARQKGLFHRVHKCGEKLIFTPDNAKSIYVYDMKNDDMTYYPILFKDMKRRRCVDSALIDKKLWLFFAYAEQPIIIFDLKTSEMIEFDEILKVLPEEIVKRRTPIFWNQFARYQDEIYALIWDSSYIIKINLVTQRVELLEITGEPRKLCALAYDGANFWFAELDCKNVYKWDGIGQVQEYYAPEIDAKTAFVYNNIIYCCGTIVVIPNFGTEIYVVDEKEKCINLLCTLPDGFSDLKDERKVWRRFFSYDISESIICMYPANANMMVYIDVNKKTTEGISVTLEIKRDEGYKEQVLYPTIAEYDNKGVIPRTNEIGLKEYLEYLIDYKK